MSEICEEFDLTTNEDGKFSDTEIVRTKGWFAENYSKKSVALAVVILRSSNRYSIEEAEDCVSEWLSGKCSETGELKPARFNRAVKNYQPEKGKLSTFLMSDLRFFISGTVLRRSEWKKRVEMSEQVEDIAAKSSGFTDLIAKEVFSKVLDNLDDRERKILVMVSDGYSNREIAERMTCSEGAVKTAIHRARIHARDIYDQIQKIGPSD